MHETDFAVRLSAVPVGLFVDGKWVPTDSESTVINPASGDIIARASQGGAAECDQALAAARRAFDEGPWPRMPREQRARKIEDLRDALIRRAAAIADLAIVEAGIPRTLARSLQVDVPIAHLDYVAEFARRDPAVPLPTVVAPRPGGGSVLGSQIKVHEPMGVVTAITPFNAPFYLNLAKVGPALAMGNTIVLKPSPLTPLEALVFGDVAEEIDLPPGVLNVVTGGVEVGEMLTTDPRIDMITFTGSDVVGAAVLRQAAPNLTKVMLELGGKSVLIARADADVDRAVTAGLLQSVTFSGQGCALWTRHLVHRSLFDRYVSALADRMQGVVIGDPADPAVQMGPLISERQLSRVEGYVDRAVDAGAEVVTGGRRPPGLERGQYYEPTLIVNVTNDSEVAQDEIFGPVTVVMPFDSDDEAIALANDSRYGLSGGIFSADSGTAFEMSLRIRTGGVSINGGVGAPTGHAPFGGYKRSGLGRERGEEGMWEYTELKTISFNAG